MNIRYLPNFNPIYALAGLTFKEAVRSRIFIIIFIIGLIAVVLSSTVESISEVDKVKLMRQWIVLIISGTSIICALFSAAFSIPFEIESKRIQMLFSKPISRGSYFIGKSAGYSVVILLVFIILGICGYFAIIFSVSGSDEDADLTSIKTFVKPQTMDIFGDTFRKEFTGLQEIPAIYLVDQHKNIVETVFNISNENVDLQSIETVTLDVSTGISMRRYREMQDCEWILTAKHPQRLLPEVTKKISFHDPSKYKIKLPSSIFSVDGKSIISFEFNEFPYNLAFSPESIRLLIDKTSLGSSFAKTLAVELSKVLFILVFVLMLSAFFSPYTSIIGGFMIWFLAYSVNKIPQTIMFVERQMSFELKKVAGTEYNVSWATQFSTEFFNLGFNKILMGLTYIVPDFSKFNVLWNFVEGYDTPIMSCFGVFAYFLAWIIGIVFIGYIFFSFRDFP
ncbi:MAG: hypothetical protein K8S87_02160 [Planctomycetes bacterium]|nr:hypothetical protein [Planctomycetota bacterium]